MRLHRGGRDSASATSSSRDGRGAAYHSNLSQAAIHSLAPLQQAHREKQSKQACNPLFPPKHCFFHLTHEVLKSKMLLKHKQLCENFVTLRITSKILRKYLIKDKKTLISNHISMSPIRTRQCLILVQQTPFARYQQSAVVHYPALVSPCFKGSVHPNYVHPTNLIFRQVCFKEPNDAEVFIF